jgi:hypothetical protein
MKTLHTLFVWVAILAIYNVSAFGLTLQVTEDTVNTSQGFLTAASGKSATLLVNAQQRAFLKFDLASLPTAFNGTNLIAARLKIYLVNARTPGDLFVSPITSPWIESVTANTATPSIGATVATVPSAKLLAKHFITIDVTAAVVAALNGETNSGFALTGSTGQVYIAAKEGPSQGPAAELEIDADLANGLFPGTLTVVGNLNVIGVMRQGSEMGTAEPAGRGIIVRRIESTNPSIGSVVARTDTLTLERDGTAAGWRVVNTANPGNATIVATGMDANGNPVNQTVILGPNPYPAFTNVIFADRQFVVSFRCSFGNASEVGHHTDASLIRSPNDGGTNWIGTMSSTYNQ